MTDKTLYLLSAILLMAAATQFTRAFPFVLFSRKKPPRHLLQSARLIPGAVMVVLVFTSLPFQKEVLAPDFWVPWLSVGVVTLLHLWLNHPLVSIFGGTAFYMVLLHFFI